MAKKQETKAHKPHLHNRGWGLLLALGILFIALGVAGLFMTVAFTLTSILFIGALTIIAGFAQLIDTFKSRDWSGVRWHGAIGVFYLLAGGFIVYDPMIASALITMFIAWTLLFIGLSRLIFVVQNQEAKGWGGLLFSSLVAFALGTLILIQWPVSALWVIGLFIAIELIVNGWGYILLALAIRHHKHLKA